MKVIVSGGTGMIGRKLVNGLAQDGHEVIVLSRNPSKRTFPNGALGVRWDAQTAENWGHHVNDADVIVNLAGENISGEGLIPERWTPEKKKRIQMSRLNAGKAIVAAVAAAEDKPQVVIQASGVDYYPDGSMLREESASGGDSFLGKVVQDYWEPATAGVEEEGVRRVVLRIGIVMSMEGGALPITVLPFKMFVGGPLGSGAQWWSWVHIDDVVRGIRFALENELMQGAYNLTAPQPLQNKDFAKTIGKVLNRPSFFPAPAPILKVALGEQAAIVLEGRNVSSKKLQDAGFEFSYKEAEAALRDLLK